MRRPLSLERHTCVQRAGELLWIPDHWPHAVTSLDDSFGVAFQGRDDDFDGSGPPREALALLGGASIFALGAAGLARLAWAAAEPSTRNALRSRLRWCRRWFRVIAPLGLLAYLNSAVVKLIYR